MAQKSKLGAHKVSIGLNSRKPRKGVHARTKNSWNKNSKNYKKAYRGQGR